MTAAMCIFKPLRVWITIGWQSLLIGLEAWTRKDNLQDMGAADIVAPIAGKLTRRENH